MAKNCMQPKPTSGNLADSHALPSSSSQMTADLNEIITITVSDFVHRLENFTLLPFLRRLPGKQRQLRRLAVQAVADQVTAA